MTSLIPTLVVTFVLVAVCHARAASFESGNFVQTSGFHPMADNSDENQEALARFRDALENRQLAALNGESLDLTADWVPHAPHFADHAEKRFKPSGFLGSRGKRLLPSLEPLLPARYYQDAEKWKRQPHQGFHGSRG
ncbi:hypothetical protein BsWGS_25389 [Bradybaena similaris]